jgi:hypothetical protein
MHATHNIRQSDMRARFPLPLHCRQWGHVSDASLRSLEWLKGQIKVSCRIPTTSIVTLLNSGPAMSQHSTARGVVHCRSTTASRSRTAAHAARKAAGAAKEGEPHWAASTKAGDDAVQMAVVAAAQQAEDFLRENPELRAVHSQASIRSLMSGMEGCTQMVTVEVLKAS